MYIINKCLCSKSVESFPYLIGPALKFQDRTMSPQARMLEKKVGLERENAKGFRQMVPQEFTFPLSLVTPSASAPRTLILLEQIKKPFLFLALIRLF